MLMGGDEIRDKLRTANGKIVIRIRRNREVRMHIVG
jgi:hypothetical protein